MNRTVTAENYVHLSRSRWRLLITFLATPDTGSAVRIYLAR